LQLLISSVATIASASFYSVIRFDSSRLSYTVYLRNSLLSSQAVSIESPFPTSVDGIRIVWLVGYGFRGPPKRRDRMILL